MRRVALVAVLLLAALGLWWSLRPPAPVPEPTPTLSKAPPPRVKLPKPSAAPTRRVRQVEGAAPPAAPPPVAARPVAAPVASAPEASTRATLDAGSGDGPVDRREHATGDADQLREDIFAGMELVRDDVADCIQAWVDAGEAVDGKVNIGFQIDHDGLQDAWVTDVEAMPDGPKSCFASAVYGVDWSGISAEPIEITFPFTVRTE